MDSVSLSSQEFRIKDLENKVMTLQLEIHSMKHQLEVTEGMIVEIKNNTQDLVNIFKAGNSVKKVVVYSSTIIGAIGVIYLFLKHSITHFLDK